MSLNLTHGMNYGFAGRVMSIQKQNFALHYIGLLKTRYSSNRMT